jgi:hypothetical protein
MAKSSTAPPPDDRRSRPRRALENACLGFLADEDLPPPEQFPAGWLPSGKAQALEELATSRTPRVVKLQQLIETLRRDPGAAEGLDAPIRLVLEHTLPTDQGELPRPSQVDRARRHLDEVLRAPGGPRLEEGHWGQFVDEAGELFRFDLPERSFRGRARCNDVETARKRTPEGELVDSVVITSEFLSDQPPSAFVDYVNPENWPNCSSFWQAMEPLTPPTRPAGIGGYNRVFDEVVEVGSQELRVPLSVGFRVRADGARVWVRFNLDRDLYLERRKARNRRDRVPVDVDTGTVSAERAPGPDGPRTLVRATKYLHATKDGGAQLFPRLACDVGWPELMMAMAYRCSPDGPPPDTAGGTAGGATAAPVAVGAAEAAVQRFVQQVVAECRQGVADTGPAVQRLLSRFTGPSWSAAWVNDLLDIGVETTRRYGRVAGHLRSLADDLASATEQRREP